MANGTRANDLEAHMLGTYTSLRRLMAVVTLGFLVTLTVYRQTHRGAGELDSISAYYHHANPAFRIADVFTGALAALGVLLIAYQGYTKRESWALNVAGAALLVVVACPMDWPAPASAADLSATAWAHYVAAVVFFLGIGYVSLCRARDTLAVVSTDGRRAAYQNAYRVTGVMMILSPVVAVLLHLVGRDDAIYYAEYGGAVAFLAYWVVKSVELRLTRLETPARVEAAGRRPHPPLGSSVAEEVRSR